MNKENMIDIHTHFLPCIDDGAKDINESKKMLSDSFLQGVRLCVATPHCVVHKSRDITDFIYKRNASYKKLAESLGMGNFPEIKLGAEVYLDNDLCKYENIKELCIEETAFMLIELTEDTDVRLLSEWIYNLHLKGIKPIIAHIDRYKNRYKIMEELRDSNVLYQINASRFLTFSGRKRISEISKYQRRFIVGSDMHNMTTRKCNIKKAYKKAYSKYGDLANDMFKNIAEKTVATKVLKQYDLINQS